MSEHYAVLQVSPEATDQEVRSAYRRLALQFHPDKNPDPSAKARFQEISKAYAVLGNKEKRRMYDLYGVSDETGQDEFEDLLSELAEDLGFLDVASFLAPLFAGFKPRKREDSGDSLEAAELVDFQRIVDETIVAAGDKLQCRVCGKQFRARDAITKHIGNVHDSLFD